MAELVAAPVDDEEAGLTLGGAVATGLDNLREVPRGVVHGMVQGLASSAETLRSAAPPSFAWPNAYDRGYQAISGQLPPDPDAFIKAVKGVIDPPETPLGGVVSGVSQFLTGYNTAGKMFGTAASGLARGAQTAARGAMSDAAFFDAQQEDLSNLIQAQPALANPVTELLAIDPEAPDWLNRGKRALEGVALGGLTDGLLFAIRAISRNARARMAAPAQPAGAPALPATPTVADALAESERAAAEAAQQRFQRDWLILGDPDAPLVRKVETPSPKAAIRAEMQAADAAAKFGEDRVVSEALSPPKPFTPPATGRTEIGAGVEINFSRIESLDDVRAAMKQIAALRAPELAAAKGPVQTWATTRLHSGEVDALDALFSRGKRPLSAEETHAARSFWLATSEKLTETAEAATRDPSPGNLAAFRKMMAINNVVQDEIAGAASASGRSLNAWKIAVRETQSQQRALAQLVDEMGGADFNQALAARVAALGRSGELTARDALVKGTLRARAGEALWSVYVNALLSGPRTHVANTVSGPVVAAWNNFDTFVASRIGSVLGRTDDMVEKGEAAEALFGQIEGVKDAFRISRHYDEASTAWRSMAGAADPFGGGKLDIKARPLSADALGIRPGTFPAAVADTLGAVTNIPSRALEVEDVVNKTMIYRGALQRLAFRQAMSEQKAGRLTGDLALRERVNALLAEPPAALHDRALYEAQQATFTNDPGPKLRALLALREQVPVLKVPLTFVKTPAKIFLWATEHSPLAPLVREWRDDIAAGGARGDMALARLATGTAAGLTAADLAMRGYITGRAPIDAGERDHFYRSGKREYAVLIGDRYWSFNRIDPLGTILGVAGDLALRAASPDFDADAEVNVTRAHADLISAIAASALSKSWMSGFSGFMRAVIMQDKAAETYVERLAGSVVPTVFNDIARAQDPWQRQLSGMADAVHNRLPGDHSSLPVKRDLWGQPLSTSSGFGWAYDFVSPIASSRFNPAPIDQVLKGLDFYPSPPQWKQTFQMEDPVLGAVEGQVDLRRHPAAYWRMVELAGNALPLAHLDGLGARDVLNQMAEGRGPLAGAWLAQPGDEGRRQLIAQVLQDYRDAARQQVLAENPQLIPDIFRDFDTRRLERGQP
jgi:hypothetical protein